MLIKLSTIYANRKNKRMGRKMGIVPPSLKNYYESVFIVQYNKLMELGPVSLIMTMDSTRIVDSLNDGILVVDSNLADIEHVIEAPLRTILSTNNSHLITTSGNYIRTY